MEGRLVAVPEQVSLLLIGLFLQFVHMLDGFCEGYAVRGHGDKKGDFQKRAEAQSQGFEPNQYIKGLFEIEMMDKKHKCGTTERAEL